MTWQTGTATNYQTLLRALVNIATSNHADTATVGAGGSGYAVGDIIKVSGGTFTYQATFKVLTISGSAVATVAVYEGGAYTVNPTNPAATTAVTGVGTGCTLNLSLSATGWTAVRDTTPGGEMEIILQGIGSGSDTIFVGYKTYQQAAGGGNTAYNWDMIAMTGFNSGLNYELQPGVSPNGIPSTAGGAYVPLKTTDSFPISFWFSITGRRIIGVFLIQDAITTNYASCYSGFLNAFGTSSEFPYPIFVAGATARHDCLFNTTAPSITGLTEMIGLTSKTGPAYLRLPSGVWVSVRNSFASDTGSPSRSGFTDYLVYPCGKSALPSATEDNIVGDGIFNWNNIAPQSGIPGTAAEKLQPTPDSGGAIRWLVPATVTLSLAPDFDIWGEMDSVFWVSQAGGEANNDSLLQGGATYRMFQGGNRTTQYSFMAIKEG